ncbi:DinB family protein [Billgrantia azerbaijanica]|nr:DinB family protein [Halomonas azerbaijanica]
MSSNTACHATDLDRLIDENRQALAQLRALVERLSPGDYGRPFGADGRHTLGKHVRHIIDHYDALLGERVTDSAVDYEHRRREAALEQEPTLAAHRLAAIERALPRFGDAGASRPLALRYPLDASGDDLMLATSLERELAFLTSHTIHHMAVIGLLAEQCGHDLPTAFGVHPSTWRHWQREARSSRYAAGAR